MAYFQGKVAFRQLIFGGYLVAITRILGYNTHRWMLIVYLELFTLKISNTTVLFLPVVRRHKKTNTEKITLPRPIILGDMHGAEVFFL